MPQAVTINPAGLDTLYSPRQQDVLRYALTHTPRMIINHGAKRSGKTVIDNDLFLMDLRRIQSASRAEGVTRPQYILAGATLSSVRRNVLSAIEEKYGMSIKLDRYNGFEMFGVHVFVFGHSKVNDKDKIRGMTAWGAYINEATLANEIVFDEINGRCSAAGSRIIMDTNPDRPGHWLKTKYVDKAWDAGKASRSRDPAIVDFHWRLTDNTFLSDDYIAGILDTTPSGMFYDRNVNGAWVSADGVVYPDFDRTAHYVTRSDVPHIVRYWGGMDFGWEHPGAFVLVGEDGDGTVYILKEWAEQHWSIEDWIDIVRTVQAVTGKIVVYCDSARPDLIDSMKCAGIDARNARKDVVAGIGEVASRFKARTLYVVRENVKRFDEEIDTYVWKEGADEPVKQNDDVMDAIRYAVYTDKVAHESRAKLNTGLAKRRGFFV